MESLPCRASCRAVEGLVLHGGELLTDAFVPLYGLVHRSLEEYKRACDGRSSFSPSAGANRKDLTPSPRILERYLWFIEGLFYAFISWHVPTASLKPRVRPLFTCLGEGKREWGVRRRFAASKGHMPGL